MALVQGTGPYGGAVGEFYVVQAHSPSTGIVEISTPTAGPGFSLALDLTNPAVLSVGSYSIDNGVIVLGVVVLSSTRIRLYVTPMISGTIYKVTVVGALTALINPALPLTRNFAYFVGSGAADVLVVSDLIARTDCRGRIIYLKWTLPVMLDPAVAIIRSAKQWPFDLTDDFDVLYNGGAISEFYDEGPTLTEPDKTLAANTYYYYMVLVKDAADPLDPTFPADINDDTRAFALSIADDLNSHDWLKKNTPRDYLKMDALSAPQGGGDGFLDKWLTVMGCWLNLMRGHMGAATLMGDDDEAPFTALTSKNQSLGMDPEGFAYDFSVLRRSVLALAYIWKIKGTCPGIVAAVSMFTKWDSVCVPLDGSACPSSKLNLKTWDGVSTLEYGTGDSTTITSVNGTTTDTAAALTPSLFVDGKMRGWMGDICCVSDNTATEITTVQPTLGTTTNGAVAPGAFTIPVVSTTGLYDFMYIQITDAVDPLISEILQIVFNGIAVGVITISNANGAGAVVNAYTTGSKITILKGLIRPEETGIYAVLGGAANDWTVQDQDVNLEENQWKGYKFITTDGTIRNVISNTANVIHVDGAVSPPAAPQPYSIAHDFNGASYVARLPVFKYKIGSGTHTTLYEPTYDFTTRGSKYDPYNPLWNGPGIPLNGAWGPADIGVYILTTVTVTGGLPGLVVGPVLNTDPTAGALTVNALIGYFLNPNQNQEQLYEIVSNTANTITVSGDISGLAMPGQYYYVLTPRDATRFKRLSARLRTEFVDTDVRPHVLFY
jgi:hypothetical protein